MTDPTTVTVNGLTMSPAMWARVMAAVRGLFPTLVGSLSDDGALQAVLAHFAADWLATWESRQAGPEPAAAAQQAADAAAATRAAAEAQARSDAATGITPTITT